MKSLFLTLALVVTAATSGLVIAPDGKLLFVACTDEVQSFRLGATPVWVSGAGTGGRVDSIAYSPVTHDLFAGAARTGQLTIIDVDATGHLTAAAQVTTAPGARNGVLAGSTVYLAHQPLESPA